MKITIIGCGEAFDERYPNTSVLVEGPATLLCDCGYSVPPAIWRAGYFKDAIDIIYITHAHADHYFGLPGLLGRMWEDGRTRPLTLISQASVLDQIRDTLEYGYRTLAKRFQYPIDYRAAEPQTIGGFDLSFAPTNHAVPNMAIRIEAGGKSVCCSGDGMFTRESRALMHASDLVVHEAFSIEPSPVHADIPALLEMASAEHIGTLALVHVQRSLRAAPQAIHDAIAASKATAEMPDAGRQFAL